MSFQRARTDEQIVIRQQEIINACRSIYTTKGYDEVNLKAISEMTSFTRPAIYKYYETKEEIFLDLLKCVYIEWSDELNNTFKTVKQMTKDGYCRFLSRSLANYEMMLELLSLHLPSIENNSRIDRLVEFKKCVMSVMSNFSNGLDIYFPETDSEKKDEFQKQFFAYIYGVYQFTHHSEKQIEAMKLAGISYSPIAFEDTCYKGLLLLASLLQEHYDVNDEK